MGSWGLVVLVVVAWILFALVAGPLLGRAIGVVSREKAPGEAADPAAEPPRGPAPSTETSEETVSDEVGHHTRNRLPPDALEGSLTVDAPLGPTEQRPRRVP